MDANGDPRVVLVHDWLTGMRGGEKCLEVLCRRWPDAPLFTLLHRPGSRLARPSKAGAVRTSFLQRLPGVAPLLPLPAAADAGGRRPTGACRRATWSSASAIASPRPSGRRAACPTSATASRRCATPGTCATPTSAAAGSPALKARLAERLLEAAARTGTGAPPRGSPTSSPSARPCSGASPSATAATAPSSTRRWTPTFTARRRCRARTSTWSSRPSPRTSGSTWPSRRASGCGRPLVVIGTGQDEAPPQGAGRADGAASSAGSRTRSIRDHLRRCRALLFPGEEDFGIVPVEAQAAAPR